MARYTKMVRIDGEEVRRRREAVNLTMAEAASLPDSPSESTWDAVENARRDEFAEKTAERLFAALRYAESIDDMRRVKSQLNHPHMHGETVEVEPALIAALIDEVDQLRQVVEALLRQQRPGGDQ